MPVVAPAICMPGGASSGTRCGAADADSLTNPGLEPRRLSPSRPNAIPIHHRAAARAGHTLTSVSLASEPTEEGLILARLPNSSDIAKPEVK